MGWGMVQRGGAWSTGVGHGPVGVGHGPVDKAPGCCKVALGSNPRPSTPKMGSSKVDEQPTGGPTKICGLKAPRKSSRNSPAKPSKKNKADEI